MSIGIHTYVYTHIRPESDCLSEVASQPPYSKTKSRIHSWYIDTLRGATANISRESKHARVSRLKTCRLSSTRMHANTTDIYTVEEGLTEYADLAASASGSS